MRFVEPDVLHAASDSASDCTTPRYWDVDLKGFHPFFGRSSRRRSRAVLRRTWTLLWMVGSLKWVLCGLVSLSIRAINRRDLVVRSNISRYRLQADKHFLPLYYRNSNECTLSANAFIILSKLHCWCVIIWHAIMSASICMNKGNIFVLGHTRRGTFAADKEDPLRGQIGLPGGRCFRGKSQGNSLNYLLFATFSWNKESVVLSSNTHYYSYI